MSLDRKERDRRLRESDILKAAEHVFATKGYHKAAISDIAQEAQYAVGTIYLYFKNKQELYLT
jgi:AcrR family transcriptional regulator